MSLIGGLTWLYISTRPNIGVAHKLLCSHLQKPSSGHMTAGKHILRYLKGSAIRGIRFTSKGEHGQLSTGWPATKCDYPIASNDRTSSHCDANSWGPQDASHQPNHSNKDDRMTIDDFRGVPLPGKLTVRRKSVEAHVVTRRKSQGIVLGKVPGKDK